MKKLKGSFMALIVSVTLIAVLNFSGVVKEAKAYSLNDTVFASGMNLLFAQPCFTSWAGMRVNDTSRPYAQMLLDVSVYDNHGFPKPVTNPYTSAEMTWGIFGKALFFDGSDDYILVPDDDSLDVVGAFTVEFWILADSVGGAIEGHPIEHVKAEEGGYYIRTDNASRMTFEIWNSTNSDSLTFDLPSGEDFYSWHHIAVTYNDVNDLMIAYSDGEQLSNKTTTLSMTATTNPLRIGYDNWVEPTPNRFRGTIDEVRIYPITLPQANIQYDRVKPIDKFRMYGFHEALNYTGAPRPTPVEWKTDDFASQTGIVNNDPILPFVEMTEDGAWGFRKTYLRYIAGFQSYRMYASLKWVGNATGMILWDFTFFKDGIAQRTFAIEISPVASYWQMYFSSNNVLLKTSNLYNTTNPFDVIVDAWIGTGDKHFTIRVTTAEPVSQGDVSLTYGYDLEDINNVTRRVEWFDGWVLATTTASHIGDPNYDGDGIQIIEHGIEPITILLALCVISFFVIATNEIITRTVPSLQEASPLPLPSIPDFDLGAEDITTSLWEGVAHELGSIFTGVGSSITTSLGTVVNAVNEVATPIVFALNNVGTNITNSLGSVITAIADTVSPITTAIGNIVSPITTAIGNIASAIAQAFIDVMSDVLTALTNAGVGLWDLMVSGVDGLLFAIFPDIGEDAFSTFLTGITTFIVALPSWVTSSLGYLVTYLTSSFLFLASFLGKTLNTTSNAVTQWILIIQNIFSMISGGLGSGIDIFTELNLTVWITIIAILYPLFLFGIWEEKGLEAMLRHLTFVTNIFAWIFRLLITVVQTFITIITSLIEAIPVAE